MILNRLNRLTIFLLGLMLISSALAMQFRPKQYIANQYNPVNLEEMIPSHFGHWHVQEQLGGQVVNPEVTQRLDKLYSQTLSRIYTSDSGEFIMLSIAYGADQSDSKRLHYPEVCYPSQGFKVTSDGKASVTTEYGAIKVKHLDTVLGARHEPLTYWTTVGTKVVSKGKAVKLEQLKYGFKGYIPDGLLFRVSTINKDKKHAYQLEYQFIRSLMSSVSPESRLRLAGLQEE